MAAINRSALLTKALKVLRKHYKPVLQDPHRSVLEHLLYAVCLENTAYDVADRVFKKLLGDFVDWNDIRVSTTRELSEAMQSLADPTAAADNMRRILQHVFESRYAFDLESLHKENLGVACKKLGGAPGATPFIVAYTVQAGLAGHMVPVDKGAMQALEIVGIVTPQEAAQRSVPGMERAIPKSKGAEFGSLLHQLSADLVANPFSPSVHKVLLEINDEAKARLPKRGAKKPEEAAASKTAAIKATGGKGAPVKSAPIKPAGAKADAAKAVPELPVGKSAKGVKSSDEHKKASKTEPARPEAAKPEPAKRKPR